MNPDRYQEFRQALEELDASPGERILKEIAGLQRSFRVLGRTHADLRNVLERLENLDDPWELWAQGNEESMEDAVILVAARLQGFLAAAFSLVEHARRHRRHLYVGAAFNREIDDELQRRVLRNPHHRLAQGMRNYIMHVAPAPVIGTLHLKKVEGTTHEFDSESSFGLDREALLHWAGWTREERKALHRLSETIRIYDFTSDYYSQVDDFYRWLWTRQGEVHSREIAEANAIRARARALYGNPK